MSERMKQINPLIQTYTDEFITKYIETPSDMFISITKVKTSKDLRYASVYISVIPDNKRGTALRLLQSHSSKLQTFLKQKVHMKFIPKVSFQIDSMEAYGQTVDALLDSLKENNSDQE